MTAAKVTLAETPGKKESNMRTRICSGQQKYLENPRYYF